MSLVVEQTPILADDVVKEEQSWDELVQHHADAVMRDFNAAKNYFIKESERKHDQRIAPYTVTITPLRIALRTNDKSFVCEDFDGPKCKKFAAVQRLYVTLRPKGLLVYFNSTPDPCLGDDFYLPVLRIARSRL